MNRCTTTWHQGPFEPAPEIQAWLEKWFAEFGIEGKVTRQVRCKECGSHTNAKLAGLEVAA